MIFYQNRKIMYDFLLKIKIMYDFYQNKKIMYDFFIKIKKSYMKGGDT